jgi:hypothetical protein
MGRGDAVGASRLPESDPQRRRAARRPMADLLAPPPARNGVK